MTKFGARYESMLASFTCGRLAWNTGVKTLDEEVPGTLPWPPSGDGCGGVDAGGVCFRGGDVNVIFLRGLA